MQNGKEVIGVCVCVCCWGKWMRSVVWCTASCPSVVSIRLPTPLMLDPMLCSMPSHPKCHSSWLLLAISSHQTTPQRGERVEFSPPPHSHILPLHSPFVVGLSQTTPAMDKVWVALQLDPCNLFAILNRSWLSNSNWSQSLALSSTSYILRYVVVMSTTNLCHLTDDRWVEDLVSWTIPSSVY